MSEDDLSPSVVHDEEEGLEDLTGRESNTYQVTHTEHYVGGLNINYLLYLNIRFIL